MASNLFISYDLKEPGKNYNKVIAAIKAVCPRWAKVQYSHFYARSNLTARQVCDAVWMAMDANDSLIVVDASNNQAAWSGTIPADAAKYMRDHWSVEVPA